MRRTILLSALALWVGCSGVGAASPTPVIVELFTSEGCSDCPAADTLLENIAAAQPVAGARIIALGEHVDYWDRLGWRDRFSSAAFTSRQQAYQTRFATESIYTPQMVVDGRAEFVGSDGNAARQAIARTLAAPHGTITVSAGTQPAPPGDARLTAEQAPPLRVTVEVTHLPHVTRGDRADIMLVVTESGLITDVKRGENHGKVLKHAPVVRYLATIGQIAADGTGASATADIPLAADWQRDHLALVAFVQEQRGRAILASASARLK
jgi:hypothetical protein